MIQTDKPGGTANSGLLQLITGRWLSHMIGVAAELSIAELFVAGPQTTSAVATAKDLQEEAVYRLLRGLASVGIFAETESRTFSQTPMSALLCEDNPQSLRGMARMVNLESLVRGWTGLEHSVKTGENGFSKIFGMAAFPYFEEHERDRLIFAKAMTSFSAQFSEAVAQKADLSGAKVLCDVGGSHGALLAVLLQKNPQLKGILFDLPKVVAGAIPHLGQQGVAERVTIEAGSFFEAIPSGADVYLMKHILHDWSDAESIRILQNIHAAASPGTRLLLVETIIEEGNKPQFAKILDIEMLAIHSGRERTRLDWESLLLAGGFRLHSVSATGTDVVLIEAHLI